MDSNTIACGHNNREMALMQVEEKREVILGFQKSVRQVAIQLSQFGQSFSSAQASMGRSGSKNSFH